MIEQYGKESYLKWLKQSNMSEEDLLKYKICKGFKVCLLKNSNNYEIHLMCKEDNEVKQIGSAIIFQDITHNEFKSLGFLVTSYIAQVLDCSNKFNPISGSFINNHFQTVVNKAFMEL